jgi:hypothetical protein
LTPEAEAEVRLLAEQLARMRAMLFGYSERFFERIRTWTLASLALLVLGLGEVVPVAVVFVPFLVPFAFLETGYLFFYAVFARRHAERVEQAINERFGREVLVAHRLEAAYFYPPTAPKIAAFSLGNPTGFVSGMTVGYAAGAALLWLTGLLGLLEWVASAGGQPAWLAPLAVTWTAAIAGYLVWVFLGRRDERRLERVLERAYRLD